MAVCAHAAKSWSHTKTGVVSLYHAFHSNLHTRVCVSFACFALATVTLTGVLCFCLQCTYFEKETPCVFGGCHGPVPVSVCLSVSLSVCLSVSLSLSHTHTRTRARARSCIEDTCGLEFFGFRKMSAGHKELIARCCCCTAGQLQGARCRQE